MDFDLPEDLAKLKGDVDTFVREEVIPYENDERWSAHGPLDDLRRELNAKGKAARAAFRACV